MVGIGASAGGLAAISALLEGLPAKPGMAFVVISHLAADHKSILDSLLGEKTRMPVRQVSGGEPVEVDHVYVCPPGKRVMLRGGRLHLTRAPAMGSPTLVDWFFFSLAKELGDKACGVVLSGSGKDGTEGLKAIREHGGVTFAQEPGSAQFDQMPLSAITARCVDHVLPPALIAQQLALGPRHAAPPAADAYDDIIQSLPVITGVDFSQYKPNTLRRRIAKRMAQQGLTDPAAYLLHLRHNAEEARALQSDLLIHVSSFFRDPEAFRALGRRVIAPLVRGAESGKPIRVWVPGCARGEEAYSIAMLLLDLAVRRGTVPRIQIFGTDVSAPDIEVARAGRFPPQIAADVPPARLKRYFEKVPGGYQVRPALRELCVFACQEVGSDPPFSNLDLISCRNLLIYFSRPLQSRIIETFHYALKPGGALFLGRSESLGSHLDLFTLLDRKSRIYRSNRAPSARLAHPVPSRAGVGLPLPAPPIAPPATARSFERTLVSHYAPPGLHVDHDLVIRSFIGDVTPYLEPAVGQANLRLGRMVPASVALDIRTAIRAAGKSFKPVRRDTAWVAADGTTRDVSLLLLPVSEADGRNSYLVMFEKAAPSAEEQGKPLRPRERSEVERLKRLLSATREQLQTVISEQEQSVEQLRAINEEALSANEELQSSNEELQTAKEELQSANEELATVNEELQERNQQLDRLAEELGELIAGVNIPLIQLDREARIRRFSPSAKTAFNLIAADEGRELGQLKPALALPDFDSLVMATLQRGLVCEREVQDRSGRWHSLRLRPLRGASNRIEGALIALIDIDATKRGIAGIVETMDEPVLVLDNDFRVQMANPAFQRTFRTSAREIRDAVLFELGNHQWDVPELHRLLENVLPKRRRFDDFRVQHVFPQIGAKVFLLSGQQIVDKGIGTHSILLMFKDATRAEAEAAARQTAREEEGRRIAHELHDLSSGVLASLGMELAQLARLAISPEVGRGLESVRKRVQLLSSNTHDLARLIHPTIVDDLGLRKALQAECRSVEESNGLRTGLHLKGPIDRLPDAVSLCVYRVVQEALRNVVRHSGAKEAEVAVEAEALTVKLLVKDSGSGFDSDAARGDGRIGLIGMADRVIALGGSFRVESAPGKGTTVHATIPVAQGAAPVHGNGKKRQSRKPPGKKRRAAD